MFFMHVNVVVQFYPWFKFYFLLFQNHYHTFTISLNKKKLKISTKNEIEPQDK